MSKDEMLQIDLCDGRVRVMLCETTETVLRCADIHSCTPVCTAALGRLITGTAMLGIMMKGEKENVTVTLKGDGPMGTLVAVADHGKIRACADDPKVELPPREDGKLDVGGAVGHHGRMIVIKDLQMKENYIGQTELVSGITSFSAAAARLNVPLVEWDELLHVFPAAHKTEDELNLPGTYVLMKSASYMKDVKELLRRSGKAVAVVENCGMENEHIYRSVDEIPDEAGYFSLIIAKDPTQAF